MLQAEICEIGIFRRGWVSFGKYFGWKWIILSNPRWSGKIRDTPVLYGVEIVEDDYFVLSQCMHLTDRETDGQTKFDSNAVRCIICRTVKT